jgi:hypothetical protein
MAVRDLHVMLAVNLHDKSAQRHGSRRRRTLRGGVGR